MQASFPELEDAMHDGYAGDHKDYYKFIILKALAKQGKLKVSVCWMLTPPAGRANDDVTYLNDPDKWRRYDPKIFDAFNHCVNGAGNRTVANIQELDLVPNAQYFSNFFTNDENYWGGLDGHVDDHEIELIFFDPNTGLQQGPSLDHLALEKLRHYYEQGFSTLFIQFHTNRNMAIEQFLPIHALEIIAAFSEKGTAIE